MTSIPETNPPQSFEAALAELEGLVAAMEGGQMTLEASLAAYRRGAELLKHCQAFLQDAEQQVKVLEGDTLRDYSGAGGSE
jgi:exodeoxyribonuclease VII small subunit